MQYRYFTSCFFVFYLSLFCYAAGTSTDVSRYAGQYEHVFEATTAGVTLQAPQLDINTVAAGGGSRLFFRLYCTYRLHFLGLFAFFSNSHRIYV